MKKVIIQALQFFGISGIGWLLDMFVFTTLTSLINLEPLIANLISAGIAATVVYILATKKIIINREGGLSLKFKYILFILWQVLIIISFSFFISELSKFIGNFDWELISEYSAVLSKILLTPVTMILNFVFMKLLIEKL